MVNEKADLHDSLLRTTQIIIGALCTGVITFLVIVILFMGARPQPLDTQAVVSIAMAALAFTAIVARLFVPGLLVQSSCQKIANGTWVSSQRQPHTPLPDTDEGKLLQVFLSKTIVGAGLLEGGAFGCLVAFMLEGQIYSIVLAILLLLGILLAFPTRHALAEWLETQLRRVQEFRSMK